jgi:hypothetical protein
MSGNIPEWVGNRLAELADAEAEEMGLKGKCHWPATQANPLGRAFARYIAEHEEPPVDPDLELARECAAKAYGCEVHFVHTTGIACQSALAAIKATRERLGQ